MRIFLYSSSFIWTAIGVWGSSPDLTPTEKKRPFGELSGDSEPIRKRRVMRPTSQKDAERLYMDHEWTEYEYTPAGHRVRRATPSTDRWESLSENVPQWVFPEISIYFEEERLGSSNYSIVYAIKNHADWAIKYHSFCSHKEELQDALPREMYFLELLSLFAPGVAPKVKYMSGEFVPRVLSEDKMPFPAVTCPSSPTRLPVVRFMILERVVESLLDFLDACGGEMEIVEAVDFGRKMFLLLEKLHAINVIHGDIHVGNIGIKDESDNLVLLDFGRSVIASRSVPRIPVNPLGDVSRMRVNCHCHLSHWESVNDIPPSYRDDAFRVLLVLANLMYGKAHCDVQLVKCGDKTDTEDLEQYMNFKRVDNFFDTAFSVEDATGIVDHYDLTLATYLMNYPEFDRRTISTTFGEILTHVRSLSYAERPDYTRIIALLDSILEVDI